MYICNTGLDCEDCVGGCDHNLEWIDVDVMEVPDPDEEEEQSWLQQLET